MPVVGDEHRRSLEVRALHSLGTRVAAAEEEILPRHREQRLNRRHRQERKAKVVVVVRVPRAAAVYSAAAAAFQRRVRDEEVGHVVLVTRKVTHVLVAVVEVERGVVAGVVRVAVPLVHRGDDDDPVTPGGQRRGQGAAHVAQPAGFAPRRHLRGDEDDGHALVHGFRLPVQLLRNFLLAFIPLAGRIAADGGEEAEHRVLRPVEDAVDDDVVLLRRGFRLHGCLRRLLAHRSLGDGVAGNNRCSPVYFSPARARGGNSDTLVRGRDRV